MSANSFRKRKAREERDAHIAKGDWVCAKCSRIGLVWWHGKDEPCRKGGKPT